jgi:hypothetical protein
MNIPSYWLGGLILLSSCHAQNNEDRPNILWIILDDTGCDFSCYGNTVIQTPVVDSLARNGILFTNMHVTSPSLFTFAIGYGNGDVPDIERDAQPPQLEG